MTVAASSLFMVTATAAAHTAEIYVIRASAARMRSSPSLKMDSTYIKSIPYNRRVEVLERKAFPHLGTWLKVRVEGKEGWINAKLLKPASASASASASAKRTAIKRTPVKRAAVPPKAHKKSSKHPAAAPVAKEAPAQREEQKPEPKKKPRIPVVDISNVNKCISRLDSLSAEDRQIAAPLIQNGRLQNAWASGNGTGFSLSTSGNMKVTVNALPPNAVKSLAASAGYPEFMISTALSSGMISFNAQLCMKNGKRSIELVGVGTTAGKTGVLALKPSGKGFRAAGQIAGAPINESFSAR